MATAQAFHALWREALAHVSIQQTNAVVAGDRFDLYLEDLEQLLAE